MEIAAINQITSGNIHMANAAAAQGGLNLSPCIIQGYEEENISTITLQKKGLRVRALNVVYNRKGIIYTERIPKFDVTISGFLRGPSLINLLWQQA